MVLVSQNAPVTARKYLYLTFTLYLTSAGLPASFPPSLLDSFYKAPGTFQPPSRATSSTLVGSSSNPCVAHEPQPLHHLPFHASGSSCLRAFVQAVPYARDTFPHICSTWQDASSSMQPALTLGAACLPLWFPLGPLSRDLMRIETAKVTEPFVHGRHSPKCPTWANERKTLSADAVITPADR